MAQYDESEYFTDSKEEIAEREAQEALLRTVRTEIRRVQSGAADEDIADDIAREEEEQKAAEEKAKRKAPLWVYRLESFFTGDILLAEQANRIYSLLTLLGVIFLVSIFTIFGTFQQDVRCNKLRKEVAMLKERAIRTSEECTKLSSHSAILSRLKARGIEIEDPKSTPTILK